MSGTPSPALRAGATVTRQRRSARAATLHMHTSVSRIRDRWWHELSCSVRTALASAAGTAPRAIWPTALVAIAVALVACSPDGAGASGRCDRVASPHGKIKQPKTLLHKLRPGQVGCLRAGVYRVRQVVITKSRITLRSYPGDRATWQGRIVVAAPRVTLQNLDLDGRAGPPCRAGCYPREAVLPSPTVNAPHARLIGNDIVNPGGICVNIR